MNFSIYLRDELGKKLQRIAKQDDVSRNNLITEAVENFINQREAEDWGKEVLNWEGCSEFELANNENLTAPKETIF